ncbi:hypothetical protein ACFXDO_22860 [Streptomyces nigra]|uniref:hypothetical protein n=1 Tax=Streptomyces nigra TaxID=1827580 RepID=UPI0036900E7A
MTGMIERLPGWPALPDLFGWVESGLPGVHAVRGLHGIRVEEQLADGKYVLRAELPGIDPAEDPADGRMPDCQQMRGSCSPSGISTEPGTGQRPRRHPAARPVHEDLTDADHVPSLGERAHRGERLVRRRRCDERHQTARIGDDQRTEAEQIAGGGERLRHGDGASSIRSRRRRTSRTRRRVRAVPPDLRPRDAPGRACPSRTIAATSVASGSRMSS